MYILPKVRRRLRFPIFVYIIPKRVNSNSSQSKDCQSKYFDRGNDIRVRFAPSPTGLLHLGSIRTALYNYLFAKSRGGKFILRIEDTDQSRTVPGATEQLEEDLKWVGLAPDEGPSNGGVFGPYIQSERLHLYKEAAKELLDRRAGYMCFCTESRLDLLRRDALRRRQVPRYDNRCRHIDPDVAKKRALDGEKYCIRFKKYANNRAAERHFGHPTEKIMAMEETIRRINNQTLDLIVITQTPEIDGKEGITFRDLVYGSITFGGTEEGDPVVLKADGFPTYHLANVVDDHDMLISHVLRGVEWQVSTPKHILLYRALGWSPPLYAHLPLILNADGSKLSKRQGDIQIGHYRESGIFPTALLNYVTDAGGGFPNRDTNVSLTLEELASHFDIMQVGTNSCRLRPDRLGEFNRRELKRLLQNEASSQQLVRMLQDMIKRKFHGTDDAYQLDLEESHVRRILNWGLNRIHSLQDIVSPSFAFLWVLPSSGHQSPYKDLIDKLSAELFDLPNEQFRKEILSLKLRDFSEKNGISFGQFMKLIRQEITGLKEGPGVAEMLELLGKDSSIARLKRGSC